MRIITALMGLLLVVVSNPATGRAGACAGPYHFVFVTVDGGRALQRNRPVTVRYGLNLSQRGGWPHCRPRVTPAPATATLSWSRHRQGPWTRIARGRTRQVTWTPTRLGLGWLRVQATDPYKRRQTHISAVLVGQGTVRLPAPGSGFSRAQLWAQGRPTNLAISRRPADHRALALPRTAAWWLVTGRRNHKAWVRVTAAGKVHVTHAPATLRVYIGDVIRTGWQVWVHHVGMPRVVHGCAGECYLKDLPAGRIRLMVRPAASAHKPRAVALTLGRLRAHRVVLSAMHLLARKPQPSKGRWTLFASPTVRAKPGRGGCRNARPFDGPRGAAALGKALCGRSKKGGAWVARLQPPGYLARGPATPPVVHGKHILWAESEVKRHNRIGRVLLYVATPSGVIVERVPMRGSGRAHGLAVTKGGDVYVVGQGFVAVRRKGGWKIHRTTSTLRAVAVHGRGIWALSRHGLTRCARRCRTGPQSATPLTGFVIQGRKLRVVAENGSLYAIGRRRLRRTQTQPFFKLRLSRVVAARGGTYGLFGPRIASSEYHIYCVGSVVAKLTPRGWRAVHRVRGRRGRTLDCQDDDRRPPVVVDLAAAGRTVYARQRARKAGLLPGFRQIHRAKSPKKPPRRLSP